MSLDEAVLTLQCYGISKPVEDEVLREAISIVLTEMDRLSRVDSAFTIVVKNLEALLKRMEKAGL